MVKSIRNILLCFLVILSLFIMKGMSHVLLPLVVALMLVSLYVPLFDRMNRKKIPVWLITPILAVGTIVVLSVVVQIFVNAAQSIFQDRIVLGQLFYNKINSFIEYLNSTFPVSIPETFLEKSLNSLFSRDTLSSFAGNSFSVISSFGRSFFMFSLYFLLLLFGMPGYYKFVAYIAGEDQKFLANSTHIQKSIVSYMTVKFVISMITGIIALITCLAFGIKYAIFWGFITFLLNFIPTVGSIIATALPSLIAFIQFDSFLTTLVFILILFAVQLTIGQIIEPRIMGNRLRLNTVTVIFGLVFWSYIWGIPGAFLSVPLMVILKIFLQNNDSFNFVSRIMGQPEK